MHTEARRPLAEPVGAARGHGCRMYQKSEQGGVAEHGAPPSPAGCRCAGVSQEACPTALLAALIARVGGVGEIMFARIGGAAAAPQSQHADEADETDKAVTDPTSESPTVNNHTPQLIVADAFLPISCAST